MLATYWGLTLAVFVIVEAFELGRFAARVAAFGWREGVLIYDVSQWARNFTFGMFYAFTVALVGSAGSTEPFGALAPVADAILRYGQYVVLLLLLVELALMARWLAAGEIRTAA